MDEQARTGGATALLTSGGHEQDATPLVEIEAELCTLAGQIAAASCRFLELVAEFDRREGWAGVGILSCAHWLSWRCGLDLRTAREHVRVARSLAGLPLVRTTFSEGRLSYSKVRAIVRVATPTSEADLVQAGLHAPAAQLERLTRGLDTAGKNARKAAAQGVRARGVASDGSVAGLPKPRPEADRDRSYVQWRLDEEGRLVLWGRLDPVEGASLLAAASRAVAEDPARSPASGRVSAESGDPADSLRPDGSAEPSIPGPRPGRPSCQPSMDCRPPSNLAAAICSMAETMLATRELPRFAPAAEVTVLVGLDELQEALAESNPAADGQLASDERPGSDQQAANHPEVGPRTARLQDGPALNRAALRRLVDDGHLRTAVLAGDGRTLDLGRRSRRLSKPQLATLWRRDGGCRAPACSRTRYLHAHHVRFWSRGGRTSLDNLVLLCGEHHRALHEGRFRVAALGDQRFAFRLPDGRAWLASPPTEGEGSSLAAAHPEVTERTITPDWDGHRLNLGLAVTSFIDSWAAKEDRPA